jgi:hypothetical protein
MTSSRKRRHDMKITLINMRINLIGMWINLIDM